MEIHLLLSGKRANDINVNIAELITLPLIDRSD